MKKFLKYTLYLLVALLLIYVSGVSYLSFRISEYINNLENKKIDFSIGRIRFSKSTPMFLITKVGLKIEGIEEESFLYHVTDKAETNTLIKHNNPIFLSYDLFSGKLLIEYDGLSTATRNLLNKNSAIIDGKYFAKVKLSKNYQIKDLHDIFLTILNSDNIDITRNIRSVKFAEKDSEENENNQNQKIFGPLYSQIYLSSLDKPYYETKEDFLKSLPKKLEIIFKLGSKNSDIENASYKNDDLGILIGKDLLSLPPSIIYGTYNYGGNNFDASAKINFNENTNFMNAIKNMSLEGNFNAAKINPNDEKSSTEAEIKLFTKNMNYADLIFSFNLSDANFISRFKKVVLSGMKNPKLLKKESFNEYKDYLESFKRNLEFIEEKQPNFFDNISLKISAGANLENSIIDLNLRNFELFFNNGSGFHSKFKSKIKPLSSEGLLEGNLSIFNIVPIADIASYNLADYLLPNFQNSQEIIQNYVIKTARALSDYPDSENYNTIIYSYKFFYPPKRIMISGRTIDDFFKETSIRFFDTVFNEVIKSENPEQKLRGVFPDIETTNPKMLNILRQINEPKKNESKKKGDKNKKTN